MNYGNSCNYDDNLCSCRWQPDGNRGSRDEAKCKDDSSMYVKMDPSQVSRNGYKSSNSLISVCGVVHLLSFTNHLLSLSRSSYVMIFKLPPHSMN